MCEFQSTPSEWRVTVILGFKQADRIDFNPHPPSGGWLCQALWVKSQARISIHTLRVEGDLFFFFFNCRLVLFQSTPSEWRVTKAIEVDPLQCYMISIHTLRVEGDLTVDPELKTTSSDFNPHPPSGGWLPPKYLILTPKIFQSTPSEWRVTKFLYCLFGVFTYFNPHPPSGGWPARRLWWKEMILYFNPHPPSGGWQHCSKID